MSDFALSPWQMWGTSQTLTFPIGAVTGAPTTVSQQLAKVDYKRPDTWKFLLVAAIENAPDGDATLVNITIAFDLIIGLGRDQFQIRDFVKFGTSYSGPGSNVIGQQFWTAAAQTTTLLLTITDFPAESIQASARMGASSPGGPTVGQNISIRAGTFFAPVNHIRPEWYSDSEAARFRGQEQGGS